MLLAAGQAPGWAQLDSGYAPAGLWGSLKSQPRRASSLGLPLTEGQGMGWLRPATARPSPWRACLPGGLGRPPATAASQPFSISLFFLF